MNYIPEIRNRCDVWEEAFCRYCIDPPISSVANRYSYTYPELDIDPDNQFTFDSHVINIYS